MDETQTVNLRDMPKDLVLAAKDAAALLGMSLKDYIIAAVRAKLDPPVPAPIPLAVTDYAQTQTRTRQPNPFDVNPPALDTRADPNLRSSNSTWRWSCLSCDTRGRGENSQRAAAMAHRQLRPSCKSNPIIQQEL